MYNEYDGGVGCALKPQISIRWIVGPWPPVAPTQPRESVHDGRHSDIIRVGVLRARLMQAINPHQRRRVGSCAAPAAAQAAVRRKTPRCRCTGPCPNLARRREGRSDWLRNNENMEKQGTRMVPWIA